MRKNKHSKGNEKPLLKGSGSSQYMMRLPDFIGMGVVKCGTTWTFRQLQQHPQIYAPIKELHFFDWERFTLHQYKHIFGGGTRNSIRGEWTPEYFTTDGVPSKIKQLVPDVKLICILRNPVERAWSNYKSARHKKHIPHTCGFLKAFFGNYPKNSYANSTLKQRGLYHKHLSRWFKHFPREQMKIMFFDDLVSNPVNFIQSAYRWLRVDDTFVSPNVWERPIQDYNKQNITMSEYARKEVLNFYVPSIEKLEQQLGLLLPNWKV